MAYIQNTHANYDLLSMTDPSVEYTNMRKWILNHIHDVLRDYSYDESRLHEDLIVKYSSMLGDVNGYELSASGDWWVESFDDINNMIENISQEDEDIVVTQMGIVQCQGVARMFVLYTRKNANISIEDFRRAVMLHGPDTSF